MSITGKTFNTVFVDDVSSTKANDIQAYRDYLTAVSRHAGISPERAIQSGLAMPMFDFFKKHRKDETARLSREEREDQARQVQLAKYSLSERLKLAAIGEFMLLLKKHAAIEKQLEEEMEELMFEEDERNLWA